MTNKIVFASNNEGKLKELSTLIPVISQKEFSVKEIPETGLTFVENAILKARHAAKQTGLSSIADDSGLLVDYLNGAPGIYSARFAGESAVTEENIKKLLTELNNVPEKKRTAHFYCVLVYMKHELDPTPLICEGIWEGIILKEPIGKNGFGYDPVFFDPIQNCSAAQMPLTLKNQISHRAKAIKELRICLEKDNVLSYL